MSAPNQKKKTLFSFTVNPKEKEIRKNKQILIHVYLGSAMVSFDIRVRNLLAIIQLILKIVDSREMGCPDYKK